MAGAWSTLTTMVIVGAACNSSPAITFPCGGTCTDGNPVQFELSCRGANVTSVRLVGPCAIDDADGAAIDWSIRGQSLYVFLPNNNSPGACQMEILFDGRYKFSTDVQFIPNDAGPCCPPILEPSPGIKVDNPPSTCRAALDAAE